MEKNIFERAQSVDTAELFSYDLANIARNMSMASIVVDFIRQQNDLGKHGTFPSLRSWNFISRWFQNDEHGVLGDIEGKMKPLMQRLVGDWSEDFFRFFVNYSEN